METTLRKKNEIAAITELIEKAEQSGLTLGRTQLMKLLFLLKAIKRVPLDYNFRLYSYGPHDSEVIDDLAYAELLGAIRSQVRVYAKGYQYQFSTGEKADKILESSSEFLGKYSELIKWAVSEFGQSESSELEMLSTLLFVDKSAAERNENLSRDQLISKLMEIKPELPRKRIEDAVDILKTKGMIAAA